MSACRIKLVAFIEDHSQIYFNIYYWFRVVFIHLVPCSALVVLTALLVNAMRRAQDRRQLLLKQNRRSESRRLAESNWTTLMLVAVVSVFLVVELPLAVLLILLIVSNTFEVAIFDDRAYEVATLFVNMVILLSYPFNFVIYCAMSRQFRSTFRGMFCPGSASAAASAAAAENVEQTNYVTLVDNERCDRQKLLQEQDKQPPTVEHTVETHL